MSDRQNRWDYRLFRVDDGCVELRQVRYDDAGQSLGFSAEGVKEGGTTAEEFLEDLELVLNAFEKPVLVARPEAVGRVLADG